MVEKSRTIRRRSPDVQAGCSTPLFPEMDPLLGFYVGRDGDRVVVHFDRKLDLLELNSEQARLFEDLIKTHRKALNTQARRRDPNGAAEA